MSFVRCVKQAFLSAVERDHGNLRQLSLKSGVDYSTIHNLKSGKSAFEKMSIQTLEKLAPYMRIVLCSEEDTGGKSVYVCGANHAPIANGTHAKATVRYGKNAVVRTETPVPVPATPDRAIDRDALELQILESDYLTAEEQKKFLIFLKKEIK